MRGVSHSPRESSHLCATRSSVSLVVEGVIDLCATPEAMKQDGQLAGHGDDGLLSGDLAAARGDSPAEPAQVTVLSEGSQDVVGGVDQQSPQVAVAVFGDASLGIGASGLLTSGDQPQVRPQRAA